MSRLGADPRRHRPAPRAVCPPPHPPPTSPARGAGSVQRALFHAFQVARAAGSTYVDPDHLFFALVLAQDAPAGQIPRPGRRHRRGPDPGVRENRPGRRAERDDGGECIPTPNLDRFGTDLTARAAPGELDPVIGRTDEIEQTIEILSRRTKNNPVLIGEALAWGDRRRRGTRARHRRG